MAKIANKYQLGDRIGAGGMAEVFFGELHGTQGFVRPVAIKRLHTPADRDALLTREARICSRLQHPNVVSVLDFERDDHGRLLLIMEWVDGLDLAKLARWQQLPIVIVEYIVASMLRGLAYAHDRGVIHRDVTPRNVLISRTGDVKLTDFGLAKAREPLEPLNISTLPSPKGTPGYMSPEQLLGHPLDARSDLFSVGVILYELLTEVQPFHRDSFPTMVAYVLKHQPTPAIELRPEMSQKLNDITMRLLKKDPADRFASAEEVIDALPASKYGAEDLADMMRACMEERRSANDVMESGKTGRPEDNPEAMRLPEYQAKRPRRVTQSGQEGKESKEGKEHNEREEEREASARTDSADKVTQDVPEEDPDLAAMPPPRVRVVVDGQSIPDSVSIPDSAARARRGRSGAILALVAFCAGIALALVWMRNTPDAPARESAPLSIEQDTIEDARPGPAEDAQPETIEVARPDPAEDARADAGEEEITAEPVAEDAATADTAASIPTKPARSRKSKARSRASTRPAEQPEEPESATTWHEVPIGTDTRWDIPIKRGED